jgi:hypothetical protein
MEAMVDGLIEVGGFIGRPASSPPAATLSLGHFRAKITEFGIQTGASELCTAHHNISQALCSR